MITFQEARERKTQEQQTVFDAINEYKKTGSETTLNFIIETLRPYTGAVALSMLRSYKKSKSITTDAEEMAWDVSSIVLVKLWKHLKDFRNKYPASIYAWIGITVEHAIIDEVRKTSSELLQFSSDDYDADDNHMLDKQFLKGQGSPTDVPDNPENIQVTQEMRKVIMGLLDELPTKDAQILRFKYMHHMKNTDIAEEMGVSLSTVAHRSKSAEQKLLLVAETYQKKTGTKLYSLAIFELLGVLYYMSAQETTVPESAYAKFNQLLTEQVASEPVNATGKEVVKRVVEKATDTVTKKIIIGVITVAIVTSAIIGLLPKPDSNAPVDTPIDTPVEEPADNNQADDFNPEYLILTDELKSQLSVITEYYWKNTGTIEFETGGTSLFAQNDFLSVDHFMQLLRDLVITENMLKRESPVEMTAEELSDFIKHTLNFDYESNYEPVQLENYFEKTTNGTFLITAGTPLGYDHKWIFTGVERTHIDDIIALHGYAVINNQNIYVTVMASIDPLSQLNGYRIGEMYFSDVKQYGTDIKTSLTDTEIENITWLGKIFWDELAKKTGTISITLDFYSTMISKMLATDNVLNKSILTDSQNQKYVLATEQEIYDFASNTLNYVAEPGEISQCFSKNESGNYIVYATNYPSITAEQQSAGTYLISLNGIHLSHVIEYSEDTVAFVFLNPNSQGGTMILLATRNTQSYLADYAVDRLNYKEDEILKDNTKLLDYINTIANE